ncbi:hypothetical protein G7Y89_g5173 [Cudoniella acicularis]|uniref:Uncharacterized protein n=1 Tax=Cudoniella acicularis TaxID=354080 RepID=A0A8H4RQ77_9HELO|nr:hypothetical protein G7Y89_g5173 [Cudoniella acicularis]
MPYLIPEAAVCGCITARKCLEKGLGKSGSVRKSPESPKTTVSRRHNKGSHAHHPFTASTANNCKDTFEEVFQASFEAHSYSQVKTGVKRPQGVALRAYADDIVKDELSSGYDKLRQEDEVSTWLVFACRILLDIQDILGSEVSLIKDMKIDHMSLARTCNKLLKSIMEELNDRFDTSHYGNKDGIDSNNLGYLVMAMMGLDEAAKCQKMQDEDHRQHVKMFGYARGGPQLGVCGEMIESFIKETREEDNEKKRETEVESTRSREKEVEDNNDKGSASLPKEKQVEFSSFSMLERLRLGK